MNRIRHFATQILEVLLHLEDYLIGKAYVSEVLLAVTCCGWLLWFILFDVRSAATIMVDMVYDRFWICFLTTVLVSHAISVIWNLHKLHLVTCYLYSLFWFLWVVISARTKFESPFVPTIGALFIVSVLLCVRVQTDLLTGSRSNGAIDS